MTKKAFQSAAATLRATVPMMIKNQTPTTPQNYALWYAYVKQTHPKLNSELDSIIAEHGLCLPSHNEKLYETYIQGKTESDIGKVQSNLENLVNEIYFSMQDTLADTALFEQSLENNVSSLEAMNEETASVDDLISLVHEFVDNSQKIKQSTRFFNTQMSSASREISSLKQELERVQNEALHDSLSGLLNRGSFDKDLSEYCSSAQYSSVCLVLIDIDDFKRLNDGYGHVFGDMAIKAIAKRLQAGSGERYSAYRYGGEEFALLLPNASVIQARQIAETLRQSIEKIAIKNKRTGEQVSRISASFGVSQLAIGDSPNLLIDRADKQLYKAKSLGKNRVVSV